MSVSGGRVQGSRGPKGLERAVRMAAVFLLVLAFGAVGAALWARGQLRASLPALDGDLPLPGLSEPAVITRDAQGIPTVRGATRADVARATGFLHAQDRFFQMDLARRRAAGELSALVGPRAVAADADVRVHRFREVARRAVGLLSPADRTLLDAYTSGVNHGLRTLGAAPFEYLILRQAPQAWRAEDTLLVVLSMFITLQDTDGSYESALGTMHDVLPAAMVAFLAPQGTEWDSPVDGGAFSMPPVPGPDVYNLRERRRGLPHTPPAPRREVARSRHSTDGFFDGWDAALQRDGAVGSNNWAVASRLTANGGALVANDMHLAIRVPNTWYRAVLEWPGGRLMGVTLPGVPALVVGSNGHVAWGFTNTYADWHDLVILETDPSDRTRYRTPDGWRTFDVFPETISVAGEAGRRIDVRWTIWGPVLGPDHRGRLRAYSWVAHSAERLAGSLTGLEDARTLEDAFDHANGLGTPGQNLVAADRSGRIGWTVYGAIPRRVGFDGARPASWADGTRGWRGWLEDAEYPRLLDGRDGRIWTANARVVGGEMLAKMGDGSYEVGSRARIIRDRLMASDRYTPQDLLRIQLDAKGEFLARWRHLLLDTLTPQAVSGKPRREEFRRAVESTWTGEAAPHSAAYRFVRAFRDLVSQRAFAFVLVECQEADPAFEYTTVRRREGPLWRLVTEKPKHLLDPSYETWDAFLLDAIDTLIEDTLEERSGPLAERTWAEFNAVRFEHPLASSVPLLGRWLNMPVREIPGDLYTPRMMWGASGASERMVVSPGREHEGLMHMPTGQSGHPLSAFYANSHDAWVEGRPTPFLPGAPQHTLRLQPQ